MKEHYKGVDFANQVNALESCFLTDDGTTLVVHDQAPSNDVMLTAVDCPLGTTLGMMAALRGLIVDDVCDDGFKSRRTESWLREEIRGYQTFATWEARPKTDRLANEYHYFNSGGHLQPTLGMKIVPACLRFIADEFADSVKSFERRKLLGNARLGGGRVVEAHPRTYLYSAVERIHRISPLSTGKLRQVREYSDRGNRAFIRDFLVQNPVWLGISGQGRIWQFSTDVTSSPHLFDAWLCAMTSWSHRHRQTITWQAAGLDEESVKIEGHILILAQADYDKVPQ